MASCKKCNKDNLTWDQTHHEHTGKWRLLDSNTGRPHECYFKGKYDPSKWYCSFHKVEVEGIICHVCGEFRSVVRGSELNK